MALPWFKIEYIDADEYAILIKIGSEEFRAETRMKKEEIIPLLEKILFD